MSFLTQSHQVFFGRPLCVIPSTSYVIQRLTQSLSSFRSTCPNHLNPLFLIIKLTGSNPKRSLSSSLFLLSHPFNHTHFSAIHIQFMLYFHRQSLTAMHQKISHVGTDDRLHLSGDFRYLIVEQSLTFRRASLTNLCLRSYFVWNQIKFYRTHFLPSSKSRDKKLTNIKKARSNLDIVL